MTGDADLLYVLARRALLDGLAALQPHLDSVVVVGAQAVNTQAMPPHPQKVRPQPPRPVIPILRNSSARSV